MNTGFYIVIYNEIYLVGRLVGRLSSRSIRPILPKISDRTVFFEVSNRTNGKFGQSYSNFSENSIAIFRTDVSAVVFS